MEKALVVLSGGQDSTTCAFWALREFDEVHAVTFDYGQRHATEIEAAREIVATAYYNKTPFERAYIHSHNVLNMELLSQLAPNALTRKSIEVKAGEDGGLPSTFVDGRNMLFLTFAAVKAKQIGAKHLVTGVCETDFSGYPDCRDVFIKSLNVSLNLAMDYQFVIHTPLMWLNKAETWKLADDLGKLDYIKDETVTCYHGIKGKGCGECPSCVLRARGLDQYEGRFD